MYFLPALCKQTKQRNGCTFTQYRFCTVESATLEGLLFFVCNEKPPNVARKRGSEKTKIPQKEKQPTAGSGSFPGPFGAHCASKPRELLEHSRVKCVRVRVCVLTRAVCNIFRHMWANVLWQRAREPVAGSRLLRDCLQSLAARVGPSAASPEQRGQATAPGEVAE